MKQTNKYLKENMKLKETINRLKQGFQEIKDLLSDKKIGYLLTDESHSYSWGIWGIYTTMEKAEKARKDEIKKYSFDAGDYHKIIEIELDKKVEEFIGLMM